jgi:hypothetical protein
MRPGSTPAPSTPWNVMRELATVDPARVRAEYRDGVLTVTLPMREESRPRQIQVDGGE